MEWLIEYRQDLGIISTIVSGTVTLDGIVLVSAKLLELAAQNGVCRYFSDYRNVSLTISVLEIHNLPQTLRSLGMSNNDKVAILYSPDSQDASNFTFFDTRCFNTRLNVKVFSDSETAYTWLLGDEK